ncbi:hypothetical protein FGX01_02105, partial [Xylella fastidiosa subsp. multiplex]|nr:hypothetical protein [Xylella fastidiosa subsp. multiplex]
RPEINKLPITRNTDKKSQELLQRLYEIGMSEGGTFDRLSLDRVTQALKRQYNNRDRYIHTVTIQWRGRCCHLNVVCTAVVV